MKLHHRLKYLGMASALPLAVTLSAAPALSQARLSPFAQATSVVAEDPAKTIEATVWLNLHNRKDLDQTVAKLYDTKSPSYRHWLKTDDLARFSPTAGDLEAVKAELTHQGLTVRSTGPRNMYLKVSGSVAKMQTAFHTEIKSLNIKGETIRATTATPKLDGPAASLVAAVGGLNQQRMKPYFARPVDPGTRKPYAGLKLSSIASPNGVFYSSNCFRDVQTQVFQTSGAQLPTATYTGNRFGANVSNTTFGTLPPCGYSASEIATAYNLKPAYEQGLDGSGQTITIVDAYGSPTIADDANGFAALNGLPPLTKSNFEVLYPLGPPDATTPENAAGWAVETALDVEWAHALAPGAKIVLIVAPSNYDNDLASSIFYALSSGIGGVISNSYGGPEVASDLGGLIVWDSVSELGAALGVSVNFSTGDDGDFEAAIGVKSASTPSDSPYATAVGGTSLALYSSGRAKFQTGWGNNFAVIADPTRTPYTPPVNEGFGGGAGGGESIVFLKPTWQSSLPGTGRQQPDVSLVADPYTGAEFVYTEDGVQYVGSVGGTSLSCPAFSAVWAIANQKAGRLYGQGALLGQAAPTVARVAASGGAVVDVTAYTSPTNVAGVVFDSNGATYYSPAELVAPLENTTSFYSAFYNSPFSGNWFVISFGTDSSLVTGPGWDNVTGYGTPNGLTFINAAAK